MNPFNFGVKKLSFAFRNHNSNNNRLTVYILCYLCIFSMHAVLVSWLIMMFDIDIKIVKLGVVSIMYVKFGIFKSSQR